MAIRFGSKAHRDFIADHRRQQKIDKIALFSIDKCLEALTAFVRKIGRMEPIAEKIVLEAIRNCDTPEGMTSNARIFKDYLEVLEEDGELQEAINPGGNPLFSAQQDIVRIGRLSRDDFYKYYTETHPRQSKELIAFAKDMSDAEIAAFYSAPSSETVEIAGKNYYKRAVVSARADIENFRLGAIGQAKRLSEV